MDGITSGMKQYLRRIFLIEKGGGRARATELARELHVEPASGAEMIRKLASESLLVVQENVHRP